MFYRVAEFAKLAGVTVRTLQYYDRIDLLKPSDVTESGHRLYTRHDLLRLQQIVTLKWMGFSLTHIGDMLDSESYDFRRSLQAQKRAITAERERLAQVAGLIDDALDAVDAGTLDADAIGAVIRGLSMRDELMRQYYTDEQSAGIALRAMAYTPEQMQQAEQDWRDLYAAFEAVRDHPPESESVQTLAAQMHTLIEAFTGGDPATEASLQRFNTDAEQGKLPPDYTGQTPFEGQDKAVYHLMQQALTIYRERLKK